MFSQKYPKLSHLITGEGKDSIIKQQVRGCPLESDTPGFKKKKKKIPILLTNDSTLRASYLTSLVLIPLCNIG